MTTRYFLMRCAESRLLDRAARLSVWPVSFGVQQRVNDAFAGGDTVIFVFTVTLSGSFQGAARMVSRADEEGGKAWGSAMPACRVDWMWRRDLAYAETEHLINPLSEPPQPVRAGKDGTEIEASVGKELLSLLERAPPPKQSPRVTTKPSPDLPGSVSGGGGGMAVGGGMGGGMPGMVGGGMMGMGEASPFFMGMNPLMAQQMAAMGMMQHPMMAGMMNPMAAAMMMQGMMQGMRPAMPPGAAAAALPAADAAAAAAAAAALAKPAAAVKAEPAAGGAAVKGEAVVRDGVLPPGFDSGRGMERYDQDHRSRYDRDQRYDPRYDQGGPRGFRDGPSPPFRGQGPPGQGPPTHWGHPDLGRLHPGDVGRGGGALPPGFGRVGPPPPLGHHMRDPWGGPPPQRGRDFDGPLPLAAAPRRRDDRPDLLRMSYAEYVERFDQLKELEGGGKPAPAATPAAAASSGGGVGVLALGGGSGGGCGGSAAASEVEGSAGAGGGAAAGTSQGGAPSSAEAGAEGAGAAAAGVAAGPPDLQTMAEDDYVAYCEKFSAQMGMPFDAAMVRQHYRTARQVKPEPSDAAAVGSSTAAAAVGAG